MLDSEGKFFVRARIRMRILSLNKARKASAKCLIKCAEFNDDGLLTLVQLFSRLESSFGQGESCATCLDRLPPVSPRIFRFWQINCAAKAAIKLLWLSAPKSYIYTSRYIQDVTNLHASRVESLQKLQCQCLSKLTSTRLHFGSWRDATKSFFCSIEAFDWAK